MAAQQSATDFLVIGAGLAGITFAADMQQAGASVRLLDKGRGLGGRCATRRIGDVILDHGAQYFTARNERLQQWVAAAERNGWLATWANGFPQWVEGKVESRPPGHPRFAPREGMNQLAKHLGADLDVERNALVSQITRESDGLYRAETAEGTAFVGRTLVLNVPPAQLLPLAAHLLADLDTEAIRTVEYLPAWALGLVLEQDIENADWPAIEFKEHPVLGWVARDHTKRAPGAPPTLMIHGAGIWSRDHLEDDKEQVQTALLNAAQEVLGPLRYQEAILHRWRYALPTKVLSTPYVWDAGRRIATCGDWCDGPRVEGAILSGWKLAEAIR